MNGFYQQVIDKLQEAGFRLLRPGKGSHEIWSKDTISVTVSKNCHSRHTANGIMKGAKISYKF